MNRTGLAISGTIAVVGAAKIFFPQYIIPLFELDAIVGLYAVLTALLAFGVWFGPLRFLSGSIIVGALGLSSILFAAGSMASPTLMGLRDSFIPIVNVFMILESGIVLTMIGLEKKPKTALSPLLVTGLVWQIVQRRMRRTPTASTLSASR